jgi:amidohydrolase
MDPLPPPYSGYLDRLHDTVARRVASAEPIVSPHPGAGEDLRAQVGAAVERSASALVELSHDVHAHPELGFAEEHAVASVARLLEGRGHEVEVGVYGLPTALRVRSGEDRPRVAVLAEYDALPGIGHACGHNVICATAVGAFLALAEVAGDLDGSVELLGTPAEEGGGGKEIMAKAGAFDDIDAAVMLHPYPFEVAEHPWIGVRQVDVAYRGLAAHASATAFLGRNALDAAVAAYQGLAQLRQHVLPSDRVHAIITDGGQKPNIVPERAALTVYLRSAEPETLAVLAERAEATFTAAATSTGTEVAITWDPCPVYLPVRSNHALAARYATNMGARGRQVLPAGVVPEFLTGSTDMGNVSVRVPSIHPTMAIAPSGVGIHTPEFTKHAAGAAADRGVVDGAVGLALTAADYLCDPGLRDAVAQEFTAAGGVPDLKELGL